MQAQLRCRGSVRAVAAATAVGLLLAGCSDDGADAPAQEPAALDDGSWTVLLYSMADTDLEEAMLEDVVELAGVGSRGALHVEALVDRAADDESSGYTGEEVLDAGSWTGARTFSVQPGSLELREDLGDVDTADPQVLADFIAAGIAASPAQHYALVVSDHGAGWPGVGADESAGQTTMDLAGLRTGIGDGLAAAGVDQLDLLGFDACLMATYETAATLAPLAQRMVASEELEPGHGWDYASFGVLTDPGTDADTLGRAVVDGFHAQATEQGTVDQTTLSLLDLTQMTALDDAVADLAGALEGRAADLGAAVARARATTLAFGTDPDPANATGQVDLGQLAGEISVEALDVADEADAVSRALGDVVTYQSDGQAYVGATGMSVYFPAQAEFLDAGYADVEVAAPWSAFLDAFYGAGRDLADRPAFDTGTGLLVDLGPDGLDLSATLVALGAENAATARIVYGQQQADGTLLYTGDEEGTVGDDGTVTAFYDLTGFTITDGQDTVPAYLSLDSDEDFPLFTLTVPMEYAAPDGDVQRIRLSVTVDQDQGVVTSEAYYAEAADGLFAEFTPAPDGLVFPLLRTEDGSWVRAEGPGLFAELAGLQYGFDRLPSGTELVVALVVADLAGVESSLDAEITIP
ncbi:clostripain-related cysteine peptidase [Klenkia sp. LSe6-5]|uniref:Clostripain-related cysteine peptidase n=1 Tax=Klenkia sesuvii TaxID=3103137 RepID=A0ABU8DWT2_9ACTN